MATITTCDICGDRVFGKPYNATLSDGGTYITSKFDLCATCHKELTRYVKEYKDSNVKA